MKHSIEKIEYLKKLRKNCCSINELVIKLDIPKSTVWHHIQKTKISSKCSSVLRGRGGESSRKICQKKWEEAKICAEKLLKSSNREAMLALSMLYWAEGSKKRCEFINSDGYMIRMYLNILRKVVNVSEERIMPTLRIFSGMSKKDCLAYWSGITKIEKERFVVRFNDGITRGRTKYGMCRITIKKGSNILKIIHSLIKNISEEYFKI